MAGLDGTERPNFAVRCLTFGWRLLTLNCSSRVVNARTGFVCFFGFFGQKHDTIVCICRLSGTVDGPSFHCCPARCTRSEGCAATGRPRLTIFAIFTVDGIYIGGYIGNYTGCHINGQLGQCGLNGRCGSLVFLWILSHHTRHVVRCRRLVHHRHNSHSCGNGDTADTYHRTEPTSQGDADKRSLSFLFGLPLYFMFFVVLRSHRRSAERLFEFLPPHSGRSHLVVSEASTDLFFPMVEVVHDS